MKKISFVFGTRPEAIKLAPVIIALKGSARVVVNVCITAQHRHMLDQVLNEFAILPDVDLNIMQPDQRLSELTARAITSLSTYLEEHRPDYVVVQGDTTTTFAATLAAFYLKIPVAHVEAGLRTWDKFSPFPEEINRVLTSRIADLHFAPTPLSKANLIKEGVDERSIVVTGNTVVDALLTARKRILTDPPEIPSLPKEVYRNDGKQMVLITGHRRENFGDGFGRICKAISLLAEKFSDVNFVYPVHLNPNVHGPVFALLGNMKNIFLIEPLSYFQFVSVMIRSSVILTDSGGVQEEAPSLGRPVLVMRDLTERPEGVESGTLKIIGTDVDRIVTGVSEMLRNPVALNVVNPYGDGRSADRICEAMFKALHI